jgi:hypothetical protein
MAAETLAVSTAFGAAFTLRHQDVGSACASIVDDG